MREGEQGGAGGTQEAQSESFQSFEQNILRTYQPGG
jgi:hypothetical protein